MQDQEPVEHQLMTMAKAGAQHPQAFGDVAEQTSERHGLSILWDPRFDGILDQVFVGKPGL
jgi:hypothetical protein